MNEILTPTKSSCFVLNASKDICLFFIYPGNTHSHWQAPLPFHFISENYAKWQQYSVNLHAQCRLLEKEVGAVDQYNHSV